MTITLSRKSTIPGRLSNRLLKEQFLIEAPNLTLNDPQLSIVWDRADGTRVFDVDGNEYIDFSSGLNVANVGHRNKYVIDRAKAQLDKQLQGMGDFHSNTKKIEFLKKIEEISPIINPRVITAVNGSDAVDAALKTATLATGKSNFISFYGGYHGMGAKSLEVTARHHFRQPFTKELPKTSTFLPYPYSYLWNNSTKQSDYINYSLNSLVQTIENSASGSNDIAAVIIESFQGRGGVVQAPKEFMKGVREICSKNNVLLIVDEILTGFGRTGKWFGFQHSDIEPDLITVGKGLSSGYPISAVIGNSSIMEKAWGKFSGESIHTSTFQGNPLGCEISIASIEYIQNNDLIQKSSNSGLYFKKKLKEKLESHPLVGDIRGSGLMIGIEFVIDKKSKKANSEFCWNVMREGLQEGLLFLNGGHQVNVLCLTPPLTISEEEIDYCVERLQKILEKLS
jgi:4-aminobutyrate aminotransferase/4-aminobutyrate aminotransferase/(S)-3-amino-2-methylpropionate transaminase